MSRRKATTAPGGAPLTKKRKAKRAPAPCKYGERDDAGHCPKKPRAAKSSAKKKAASGGGKPCKYGARINGRCPPKPKKAPSVKDYENVGRAAKQAGQVLRSSKATKEQKHEAVKVLGAAVATESGKKIVEHVAKEARAAISTPGGKKAAGAIAKKAAGAIKVLGTATAIGTVLAIGGAALDANRAREAKRYADRELAATKKRLGGKITAAEAATLHQQYYDYFLKLPPNNPYTGK